MFKTTVTLTAGDEELIDDRLFFAKVTELADWALANSEKNYEEDEYDQEYDLLPRVSTRTWTDEAKLNEYLAKFHEIMDGKATIEVTAL